LSTGNATQSVLLLYTGLQSEKSASNRLNYNTVYFKLVTLQSLVFTKKVTTDLTQPSC